MLCSWLCSCGAVNDSGNTVTDGNTEASLTSSEAEDVSLPYDTEDTHYSDETDTVQAEIPKDIDYKDGFHNFFQANYAIMDIDNIMQEEIGMPYGCEAVSLSIALKYFGFDVDGRILFYGYMPHGSYGEANPFYEYVGNPTDNTGYGCYAPCLVETANKYLERAGSGRLARDVSGSSIYELLGYIWSGIPVIIWGTLDMRHSAVLDSWYFDGERINWYSLSHCVVICGVQGDDFIICDPMVGKVKYPIKDVEAAYEQIYSQAVVIY